MENTALSLEAALRAALDLLEKMTGTEAAQPYAEGKWSAKEVIGHLIDSAANNHRKWIAAMRSPGSAVEGYDADFWVEAGGWQQRDWTEILGFWAAYNRHLAFMMRRTSAGALENQLVVGAEGPLSLRFMMDDYVAHFRHHLAAILPGFAGE